MCLSDGHLLVVSQARLCSTGVPNQCAIHGPKDSDSPVIQLYVATADGFFYEYSLNLTIGGKCKLERVRDFVFLVFFHRLIVCCSCRRQENVIRDSTSEEIEAIYMS